jgi:hypothetical protein
VIEIQYAFMILRTVLTWLHNAQAPVELPTDYEVGLM